MRLYRPCPVTGLIFAGAVFRVKSAEKVLYLTFDDGPDPDSTQKILEILDAHGIKAMFFMTGHNAEKYPGLKNLVISKGHAVGNHGYLHLSGWRISNGKYFENVLKGTSVTSGIFYRPPYGHLSLLQYRKLKGIFKIVFWDLMPYDFDKRVPGNVCLSILKKKMRPGSVIVLHDKPSSSLFGFLSGFISHALGQGYSFSILQ